MVQPLPGPEFFQHLSICARQAAAAYLWPLSATNKATSGYDPVTEADVAIEQALRAAIQATFPDDGICGEELGSERSSARRSWSIDPIDGTRSFICGVPSWTVLVGLIDDGQNVAGMIDAPALDELLVAVNGRTTLNGVAAKTSGQSQLPSAKLATTDPYLFEGRESEAFERLRQSVSLTRYGLDALGFARVAIGGLDLVVESGLLPHDYDGVIPVVRGAGGHVGDWRGGSDFSDGQVIAAASQGLYEAAVEALAW